MTPTPGDPLSAIDPGRPEPAFMRVRLREGYATGQVDAFIDQAVQALSSREATMRPEDVRAVRFTPTRVRAGYDMRQVDAFLDELEEQLAARQPEPSELPPCPPAEAVRKTMNVQAWVARLRWAILLFVVVLWVVADVLPKL